MHGLLSGCVTGAVFYGTVGCVVIVLALLKIFNLNSQSQLLSII